MKQDEDGFDKQDKIWEVRKGVYFDLETNLPVVDGGTGTPLSSSLRRRTFPTDQPPRQQSADADREERPVRRRTFPPTVEPPEESEPPGGVGPPAVTMEERGRLYRERRRAEGGGSDRPDETEAEREGGPEKGLSDLPLPDLPGSLAETPFSKIYDSLRDEFAAIWNEGPPDFERERRIHKEAVRQSQGWRKFLWSREFQKYRKREADLIPADWMSRDEVIGARLDDANDLDFQRAKNLTNFLWQNIIDDRDECVELAERIGAGKLSKTAKQARRDTRGRIITTKVKITRGKNKGRDAVRVEREEVPAERDYVFVRPLDFGKIQEQFGKGYSESYVKQYLDVFAGVGVLRRFDGRVGPHGQTVYAMGVWSPIPGRKFRPLPFLRKSEGFVRALREFRLPPREKKGRRGGRFRN